MDIALEEEVELIEKGKTRFLPGDEKVGPLISKLLSDFGIISLSFLCLVNLIVSGITVQQVL